MADNYNDITSTGPVGLKGLPSLQEQRRLANKKRVREFLDQEKAFINSGRLTPVKVSNRYAAQPVENVGLEAAQYGVGQSTYDQYALASRVDDLKNVRGEQQSGLLQFANGLVKMQTTAATTFLDNMFGLLWGVGEYAVGKITGNPKKDLLSSLWNNSFTNAMADFTEKMEKWVPNYTTDYEDNLPFYSKMFGYGAGNFWGNDILKNAGFTVGAAASIAATSALMGPMGGAAGIANTLGKLGKAGKFADRMVKTFISTIGESSLEALNTYRDNEKAMLLGLNQRVNEIQDQIEFEYQQNLANGMSQVQAETIRNQRTAALIEQVKQYKDQQHSELLDASNGVFGVNMAILGITNRISLGSLIKGGYGNAKSLMELAEPMVNGKLATSTKDIARGMLDGTLSFNAKAVKHGAAKVAGKAALIGASEGFLEEGSQNLASGTATVNTQARMNKWARENTELGTMLNPAAEESLVDLTKALGKAWEDNFGAANGRGWTEVAAGLITGVLGVPFLKRNAQGKIRPSWQGGLAEAYESIYGERKAVQRQIDLTQALMGSNKFGERAKNAIANIVITSRQNQALADDDLREYKNRELEGLVVNAIHARNMGHLDAYLGMFDELSEGLNDEDIQELRALTADMEEGNSFVDKMTNEELQQRYQDKAARTKEKIEKAIEELTNAQNQFKDKFDKDFQQVATERIAFKNTLLWDTKRRINKLNEEIEALQNKKEKTVSDYKNISDKKKGITQLEKQAKDLTEELEGIRKDPASYEALLKKEAERYERAAIYEDAKKVEEDYKNATTLKEIIDIYDLSPNNTRYDTLESVIDSLPEGESKERLSRFKDFIDDTDSVKYLIERYYGIPEEAVAKEDWSDYQKAKFEDLTLKAQMAQHWVDSIISEMLSEETPIDSMDTFRERFEERLLELSAIRDDYKAQKGSLRRTKTGSIVFTEALKNGEIGIDSLVIEKDEEGHDTIIGWADEVDKKVQALSMFSYYNEMIGVLNKVKRKLKDIDSIRDEVKEAKKAYREASETSDSDKIIMKGAERIKIDEDEEEGEDEDDSEDEEEEDESEEDEEKEEEEEKPKRKTKKERKDTVRTDLPAIETLLNAQEPGFSLFKGALPDGSPYYTLRKDGGPLGFEDRGIFGELQANPDAYPVLAELLNLIGEKAELDPKKDKEKYSAVMDQIIDTLGRTVLTDETFNSIKEDIEKYLKSKSKTPAKATKATKDEASKSKEAENTTSMRGTSYPKYRWHPIRGRDTEEGKLPIKKALKHTHNPLYPWLEKQGLDPQNVTDFVLQYLIKEDSKAKQTKDRTPVHYLGFKTSSKELHYINDAIYLGIEREDVEENKVFNAVLKEAGLDKYVSAGGKQYLIIGTFGYDSATGTGTKQMFDTIQEHIQEEKDATGEDDIWVVSKKTTNRIKDLTPGEIVNSFRDTSERKLYDVNELMKSKETNPNGLEAKDLRFAVIMGTPEAPSVSFAPAFDESKDDWYDLNGEINPGQVYMYIPDSMGKYLPIMIETLSYQKVLWEDSNPLYKNIKAKVKILVDRDSTKEQKLQAMGELRGLLVFSKSEDLHYYDDEAKYFPNTIRMISSKGNETLVDLNTPSKDEKKDAQRIMEAIYKLDPRIQFSKKILADPVQRKMYLESGVLKTDVACLGTVNCQLFLYPVDDKGVFIENKKKERVNPYDKGKGKNSSIFFNGERYYKNSEEEWFTSSGDSISDKKMVKLLNKLNSIHYSDGKIDIPTKKVGKTTYYIFDDDVYVVTNGRGGFQVLSDTEKASALKQEMKDKDKDAKRRRGMKSLADMGIETPGTSSTEEKKSPPKTSSKKTKADIKTPKKQKKGTYGEYFNFSTSSKVTVQSWSKPEGSFEVPTVRIYLRGKTGESYIEIAKDYEIDSDGRFNFTNNNEYTLTVYHGRSDPYTEEERTAWFEAIADVIPEGGIVGPPSQVIPNNEIPLIERHLAPYGFEKSNIAYEIQEVDPSTERPLGAPYTILGMRRVKTVSPSRTQRGELKKQAEEKNNLDKDFEEWKKQTTFEEPLRRMGRSNMRKLGEAMAKAIGRPIPNSPGEVSDLIFDFIKESDSVDFTSIKEEKVDTIVDNIQNCLHMK